MPLFHADKESKRRESLPFFASKSSEIRTSSPYDSSNFRTDGASVKTTWSCLYCGTENDFSQQTCECRNSRRNRDNQGDRSVRETDHKNSSHTKTSTRTHRSHHKAVKPRKTRSIDYDGLVGWAPEENTSSWVNLPIFLIGVIFLLIVLANR